MDGAQEEKSDQAPRGVSGPDGETPASGEERTEVESEGVESYVYCPACKLHHAPVYAL